MFPRTPHCYRCTRLCWAFAALGRPEATGSPGPGLYQSHVHLPGDPSLHSVDSHSGLCPANSSTSTATDAGAQLTNCFY